MMLQVLVRTEPLLDNVGYLFVLGVYAIVFSAIFASPIAAVLMYIAERWKIQSISYYAITGALTGVLVLLVIRGGYESEDLVTFRLVFIGGFVAGLVYWSIAGRYAGSPVKDSP